MATAEMQDTTAKSPVAPLEQKKVVWLTKVSQVLGKRLEWEETEGLRSGRLNSVKGKIDAMADELKFLSTYEIEVSGVLFNKKRKSIDDSGDGWNVQEEVDTGRDAKKMTKALPEDIMRRLMDAQDRINALQQELQNAVPAEKKKDVREKLGQKMAAEKGKLDAEKEKLKKELTEKKEKPEKIEEELKKLEQESRDNVRIELAKEYNSTPNEISQIELQGRLGDDNEAWDAIKKELSSAKSDYDSAEEELKKLQKEQKAALSKPEKVRKELDKKIELAEATLKQCNNEFGAKRKELAGKHKITEDEVEEIVGWKPFFSDLEIRKELWKPLVRAGVIADNTVPDAFNETVQTFKGANKLYQARQEKDAPDEIQEALGTGKKFLKHLTDVAGAVVAAAGGPNVAGTIINCIDAMGQAVLSGTQSIFKKEVAGVFDAIGDILGSALTTALPNNPDLATLISGTYTATCKGGGAIAKLAQNPEANWKDFVSGIGEALEDSFALCGSDDKSKAMFAQIGKSINDGFTAAVLAVNVKAALEADPPDVDALIDACSSGAQRVFSRAMGAVANNTGTVTKIQDGGGVGKSASDSSTMSTDFDSIGSGDLASALDALKANPQLMEQAKAALKKKEEESTDKELEQEMDDFKSQLALGFAAGGNDPDALKLAQESNSIEKLMAQVQADRAMLQMAEAIFDTGVKTAAEFFEPLKMATSGKDFVKNLILAVRRALELKEWITLRTDAINAASVQGFSFANRVKNLQIQVSDKTLNAVLELAQLVGAAASCSGIGYAAGTALSKAGAAAQSVKDLVMDLYKEVDLRRQWKLYLNCLSNPYDRTQMRDCIAGNPTLAKYAMAFAAVDEDDAIAKEGMKACGINEATLKNPGTNADKCVTFLETKFDEDPQLIKQVKKCPWQTAPTDLTLASWLKNKKAAMEAKSVKLEKGGTGGIETAMAAIADASDSFDDLLKDMGYAATRFEQRTAKFQAAFAPYSGALGTYNAGMQMYEAAKVKAAKALSDYNQIKANSPDPKLVAVHKTTLEAAVAAAETLGKRTTDFESKIDPFKKVTDEFLLAAKDFLEAIHDRSAIDAFRTALESLDKELKKFKPLTKDENHGGFKSCGEMQEYLTALGAKVSGTLRGAGTAQEQYKARESDVASRQTEVEGHRDELKVRKKPKQSAELEKEVAEFKKAIEEIKQGEAKAPPEKKI
jgi:hypothetical protein